MDAGLSIRLRMTECEDVAALLSAAGAHAAAQMVAARAGGLAAALSYLPMQLPPRAGLPATPAAPRVAPSVPEAASGQPSPEPQVFGPEAVARMADAAVSALPADPPAAPADHQAEPRKASTWTPGRNAILSALYPRGAALDAILARLNATPGPQVVSVEAVKTQAKKLGLRRADASQPAPAEAPAAAAPPAPKPAPPAATAGAEDELLTPARRDALAALWQDRGQTIPMIAEALNALPGREVKPGTVHWLRQRCGLPSQRPLGRATPAEVAKATLAAPAAPPPASTPEQALSRARALLREGHAEAAIVARTGLDVAAVRDLIARAEAMARDLLLGGHLTSDEIADAAGLPARAIRDLRAEIREARAA